MPSPRPAGSLVETAKPVDHPEPSRGVFGQLLSGLCVWRAQLPELIYALFAGFCVLWVARDFYASMQSQLFFAQARAGHIGGSVWSAPLDDVFIHFDFARAAARGYPFEWSEGNGYSSGGTSLLYPLVLALGYRVGYTGLDLMHWAGIVACVGCWGFLLWAKRLFSGLPAWSSFLLPPFVLSVGALNWSLFSGMEVAFFLAAWALCVVAWQRLLAKGDAKRAAVLGACCAALVACRPESAVIVALLTLSASFPALGKRQLGLAAKLLLLSAVPGALVVVAHTWANLHFTGEASAAGALVKLEMNHPYLSPIEKWEAWRSNLAYQVVRVTGYHFSALELSLFGVQFGSGWLVWALAFLALCFERTRRSALLLWACMLAWVCVVATNGQVRWQNERYTMPATAWLLVAAALGTGAVLSLWTDAFRFYRGSTPAKRQLVWRSLYAATCLGACALFIAGQQPQYRGQLWFFGRASRNIYEQHIAAARKVRNLQPARVLVGDAGAIPYIADVPALDFIGLGGYHNLPFARATRMGVGAGIEVLQRLPSSERPDLMALYPTWWGELPLWFGERLAEFHVRGNVVCGGARKVLYTPNWGPLDNSRTPFFLPRGLVLRADIDVADLVSEREQGVNLIGTPGYVTMKLLPHPRLPAQDAWDAGRILPVGSELQFRLQELRPHDVLTLIVRLAPSRSGELEISAGGHRQTLDIEPSDAWQELPVELPAHVIDETTNINLRVARGEVVIYHLWGAQQR